MSQLEYCWCDSHSTQNIMNFNGWVCGLPCFLLHFMWSEQTIGVGSYYCHHLKNDKVILVHVFQDIFVIWRWDETILINIYIFWGAWGRCLLKFEVKTRGRKEERLLPYIVHMKILIYILVFNIIWALHCFALPMTMIK